MRATYIFEDLQPVLLDGQSAGATLGCYRAITCDLRKAARNLIHLAGRIEKIADGQTPDDVHCP